MFWEELRQTSFFKMASARQLSKSGGLKSAASRQKLKQQQPNDRGVATVAGSSGEGSSDYPYMKEEHVLTLGEVQNEY